MKLKDHYNKFKFKMKVSLLFIKFLLINNLPLISILILTIILISIPFQLPNILDISNHNSAISLLSSIIGALSSILSIIIAIILVSYQLQKNIYSSYAYQHLFESSIVKHSILFYTYTIIISIICMSNIDNPLSKNNINIIYLAILLFLISIVLLFPFAKYIIFSSFSKNKILKLIERINSNDIYYLQYNNEFNADHVNFIENNPIYLLSDISVKSIQENDRLLSRLILHESTNKLLNILEHSKGKHEKRNIINVFSIIIYNSFKAAINFKSHIGIFYEIFKSLENIHLFCSKNKVEWHEVIELNEMLESISHEIIKSNNNEISRYSFYTINRIFISHLQNNLPNEKDIWELHINEPGFKSTHNVDASLQWSHVRDEYIRMIYKLSETAILGNNEKLFNTSLFMYKDIISNILRSKLGLKQIKYLSSNVVYYCIKTIIEAKKHNINITYLSLPIDSFTIIDSIKNDNEISKFHLIKLSEIIIILTQNEIYDIHIHNELGTIGRSCIENINSDKIYLQMVFFILDVFNQLRILLEKNISTESKKSLIEIFKQVSSFDAWKKSKKLRNKKFSYKLNKILNDFKNVSKYNKEFSNINIKWPDV